MRLTRDVHLVASGGGGLDLTDPYDCNAYLLLSDGEAALIDAGIGRATDELVANMGDAAEQAAVRYLLLTHAHPDHSGGAAELSLRLPNMEVLASSDVARWVAQGDEEAVSLDRGQRADFYPQDYRLAPCPAVRALEAGQRLRVGSLEVEPIPTPGHSAGHLAFLCRGGDRDLCLSGDLVFYGGLISLESNWDCSLLDYAESVRRLNRADFEALLPGHHQPSLRRGHRHVAAAARQFDRGFVPRSVV